MDFYRKKGGANDDDADIAQLLKAGDSLDLFETDLFEGEKRNPMTTLWERSMFCLTLPGHPDEENALWLRLSSDMEYFTGSGICTNRFLLMGHYTVPALCKENRHE